MSDLDPSRAGQGGLRVFRGAVAIVTGGASGIGLALSEALAAEGATVVLADRQRELAEERAAALRAGGADAVAVELDVTDAAAVGRVVDETVRRHGRLDYLFNNAGIGVGGEVRDLGLEDWNQIIDVNLRGVVHGVHAAYPVMLRQGFGHIVNTASMQGLLPGPFMASYATTKAAVVSLSRSLRLEAAAAGVRVSALCPGVIRTPLLRGGRFGRFAVRSSSGTAVDRERVADLGAALFERLRPMEPALFARAVLADLARNRAIIIVPRWWRVVWWIERVSPALSHALSRRSYEQTKAKLARLLGDPGAR